MFIVLYSGTVVVIVLRNVPLHDSRLISTWLWKETPVGNQAQSESDEAACETRSLLLVVYIVKCILLCNWILMSLVHCGLPSTSCPQERSSAVGNFSFLVENTFRIIIKNQSSKTLTFAESSAVNPNIWEAGTWKYLAFFHDKALKHLLPDQNFQVQVKDECYFCSWLYQAPNWVCGEQNIPEEGHILPYNCRSDVGHKRFYQQHFTLLPTFWQKYLSLRNCISYSNQACYFNFYAFEGNLIIFILHHFMPPSQNHKTDFNPSVHIKHGRHSKMKWWKQMEKEARTGRKGTLVSRIWGYPAALCLDFFFFPLNFLLSLEPNPNYGIWSLGNKSQSSAIYWGAFMTRSDKFYRSYREV